MRIDYLTNKEYFNEIKDFPKYFRKDALISEEQAEKLADDKFALIVHDGEKEKRYYPINNFSNTWLSAKYFEKFASTLPLNARIVAAYHIKEASDLYKIKVSAPIEKLASRAVTGRVVNLHEAPVSTDSPDEFLLPDYFMYKVASKADVEEYVKNYNDYVSTLSPDEKREFDSNLKKFANRFKVDFFINEPPVIPSKKELEEKLDVLPVPQKLAFLKNRFVMSGPDDPIREGISLRIIALGDLEDQDEMGMKKAFIGRELLEKIANSFLNNEIDGYHFASALYKIDKMFNWDSEYMTSIPDPVKMVVKVATDTDIKSAIEKEITPIMAMYKSGSIDSTNFVSMINEAITKVFSKYANNLLAKYIKTHKSYESLTKFASIEEILGDPVETFANLDLNKKLAFIKELTDDK